MKQSHFIDIENIREEESEFRPTNIGCFIPNKTTIIIQEKIDGSNASVAYDSETDSLIAFSRKKQLQYDNTLSGFWNYVQQLNKEPFKAHPDWVVFGEWSQKNKIIYDERFRNKWIVYDIFDKTSSKYLTQDKVKQFCADAGLDYIHVFYEGPFLSWEHCKSFMNSPQYGDTQEGIVVKCQNRLENIESGNPSYLKIVNEKFKESIKPRVKEIDTERESARTDALEMARSIVTLNRVQKELYKLRDEGLIPDQLTPKDMGDVAKVLPKRIYADCLKEEPEIVKACGEWFGKHCGSLTMKYARYIICGEEI